MAPGGLMEQLGGGGEDERRLFLISFLIRPASSEVQQELPEVIKKSRGFLHISDENMLCCK